MRHGSLFSGIGGFDLAAQWMGWENVFHCEWNPFCQKVLKYHFPNSISYGDITKTDFTVHRGNIDIVTGGFPCQPYSQAGKRKGKADDRHLWPEMLRAIREIQPSWIVGENVPGLLNWERGMVLAEIKADLESAGFEVFPPCILPACGKGAPHRRDRLWIIAHSNNTRSINTGGINGNVQKKNERWERQPQPEFSKDRCNGAYADIDSNERCERRMHKEGIKTTERYTGSLNALGNERTTWHKFPTQSPICGGVHGIPNRVDRIKALGNAIVPQIAYEIFKAIEQTQTT